MLVCNPYEVVIHGTRQDFPSQRLGGTPVRHSVLVHQRPQAFLFEMGAPHAGGQHPLRRRR